jgi:hypothetical protein
VAQKQRSKRVFRRVDCETISRLNELIPYNKFHSVTCNSDKLAIAIMQKFFGEEWIERHIMEARKATFLNKVGSDYELIQKEMRRILLAEMMYNLQDKDRFVLCWRDIYSGDMSQIESSYAVLEVARALYAFAIDRQLRVKFIKPEGETGKKRPDLYIILSDGVRLYAEAKVRDNESDFTIRRLENRLSGAKKQLPKNRPGTVFVKIPASWFFNEDKIKQLISMVEKSVSRSPWVVSVVLFVSNVHFDDSMSVAIVSEKTAFKEIINGSHKFKRHRGREWGMFPETGAATQPPAGMDYNGMPATWQRLIWPVHVNQSIQPPRSATKKKRSFAQQKPSGAD